MKRIALLLVMIGFSMAGLITERIYVTPTANGRWQNANVILSAPSVAVGLRVSGNQTVIGTVSASAVQVNGSGTFTGTINALAVSANTFGSGLVQYQGQGQPTSSIAGWASMGAGYPSVQYIKIGRQCTIWFSISGISNATTAAITLPFQAAVIGSGLAYRCGNLYAIDNGGAAAFGDMLILSGGSVVNFYKDVSSAAFTNTGTKTVFGAFTYPTAN